MSKIIAQCSATKENLQNEKNTSKLRTSKYKIQKTVHMI